MMKRALRVCAFALAVLTAATTARAQITPFTEDVTNAIDAGLNYIRTNNWLVTQSQSRGILLLALLEKRASADPASPILGYANSSPADQALARDAVARILGDGSYGANRGGCAGNSFYAYGFGQSMMAVALYAKTGGPEVPQGTYPANVCNFTLRAGIDKLVNATIFQQTKAGTFNGFWGYTTGGDDSSTTQYAVAGLAAAKGYYLDQPDAPAAAQVTAIDDALARSSNGYAALQNADGGEGYRVNSYASSYQQTASAMWSSLLGAGRNINSASVQRYLNWQYQRYQYETIVPYYNSWSISYYYYLWSSSKAYTLLEDAGIAAAAGNLDTADLGTLASAPKMHRNPTVDPDARAAAFGPHVHTSDGSPSTGTPYHVDIPRWYYDYAYSLMRQQLSSGVFNSPSGDWDGTVMHAYAILVLERALGGACVDNDDDSVCDEDDNCPADANQNQADADGDGVGDACDNCPDTPNADQADSDDDGVGDACACVDPDNDGVCEEDDNCPDAANADQADADGDGPGDACDTCPNDPRNDADGDGICGDADNCPDTANADQADADGDGRGDACDACPNDPLNDADGDGVCGDVDNCPAVANPDQRDTDGDGVGDACTPFAFPAGGAFVIGDLANHAGLARVNFWGAQWLQNNPTSGGASPGSNAFKGFETGNPAPTCGQIWTSQPGNSSNPPAAIPEFMGVIVTSQVSKNGPVLSGTIQKIIVVRTEPGYGPNPGHSGYGAVVAVICSN